jgi:broad specificity phosphatase PhoE
MTGSGVVQHRPDGGPGYLLPAGTGRLPGRGEIPHRYDRKVVAGARITRRRTRLWMLVRLEDPYRSLAVSAGVPVAPCGGWGETTNGVTPACSIHRYPAVSSSLRRPANFPTVTGTELLLLRHGASTWNEEQRWQGVADPPLSAAGEAQIRRAGAVLARGRERFAAVVASDLQRASRTAALLAAAIGWSTAVTPCRGLREYDVGAWSGLTHPAIETRWPGQIARWRAGELAAPPGGEPRAAFDARVVATLRQLANTYGEGLVLAVTHAGVIAAAGRAVGVPLAPNGHLAGCRLRVSDDGGTEMRLVFQCRVDLLAAAQAAPAERVPSER